MTADGVRKSERGAVVHEARTESNAPERGGANFVGGVIELVRGEALPSALGVSLAIVLGHGLDDTVAGADVVEEKVTVGMESFSAEGIGNGEIAAVNGRARGSGGERGNVAGGAANFFKERFTLLGAGRLGKRCVASRGFQGAHEASEMIDVGKAVSARLVIGLRGGVTKAGDFVRLKAAGDAHFVEIGVR